jgi:hypothetical protein
MKTFTATFGPDSRVVLRWATLALAAALALYVALATFTAVVLPYAVGDALNYGAWSRYIAEHHSLDYPELNDLLRGRPLFYLGQGGLWWAFGVHYAVGRLWSLAFGLLLLGCVIALGPRSRLGLVGGLLAGAVLVLIPDYGTFVAGGLTDVPVTALIAATAAVLWLRRADTTRDVAIGLLALATVLTKTTGVLALIALALAHVAGPRGELRERLRAVGPLVVGLAAGLAYDAVEAARVGESLPAFLRAGTEGLWARAAADSRWGVLVRSDWLGVDLRPLLWFAAVYAVLRLTRLRHRRAALAAFAAAVAGSWLVPSLAAAGPQFPLGPFDGGLDLHEVAYLLLLPQLLFTLAVPDDETPDTARLARLLVFALPVVIAWAARATYATRLVAPAWPALVLLMAEALGMCVLGALRVRPATTLAPVATVVLLVALAFAQVDSLGWARWKTLRAWGPSAWRESGKMEHLVWGTFGEEVILLRRFGPHDTIATNDDRLRFFATGRIHPVPRSCAGLAGRRMLLLLVSGEAGQALELAGVPPVRAWATCREPRTRQLASFPGQFVAFSVATP